MNKLSEEKKQQIINAVNVSSTMLEAAQFLDLPFNTFAYRAKAIGVYKPNQAGIGSKARDEAVKKRTISLEEILEGKHPTYRTARLKERMIEADLIENKCVECGLESTWNNKPIVLELDHINGVKDDHHKENLQLMCPNCHSQTPTFRGRNIKAK